MSLNLTCYAVTLSPGLRDLARPFAYGGRAVQDYFQQASNGDIRLSFDFSYFDTPLRSAKGTETYDLHWAMRKTLGPGSKPVRKIALILADHLKARPGMFGLLFDHGFTSNADDDAIPRQGCAVFLNAIAASRASSSEFATEAMFTAIHELGHVFNLGHVEEPLNFMASSRPDAPFPPPVAFLEQQSRLLRVCSQEPGIQPGGSPYGQLGHLNGVGDYSLANEPRRPVLNLSISMPQAEFFWYEPVELEITISLPSSRTRAMKIPDAVDPAYEAFTIWIEEPSGERRRYRPVKRYCPTSAALRLFPGERYSRDVSIFAGGDGYTFRCAGVHRLWATYLIGRTRVTSNVVEVNVRSHTHSSGEADEMRRILTHPRNAQVLFYRPRTAHPRACRELLEIAEALPHTHVGTNALYAVGRSLAEANSATRRAEGHRLLSRAMRRKRLTPHRRERAEAILTKTRFDRG